MKIIEVREQEEFEDAALYGYVQLAIENPDEYLFKILDLLEIPEGYFDGVKFEKISTIRETIREARKKDSLMPLLPEDKIRFPSPAFVMQMKANMISKALKIAADKLLPLLIKQEEEQLIMIKQIKGITTESFEMTPHEYMDIYTNLLMKPIMEKQRKELNELVDEYKNSK